MLEFLKPSYVSYLQEERIENLRLYKYAAIDKSPVSKYILKHYWDFAITLFPRWIAPNLITLIGLFFMIANIIIMSIWTPSLGVDGPNWINFSFAAGLWLYSTFDNVDGRQARRTGTSSPLGELFDHGCDAVNCTYVALLQCAALGLGHTWTSALLLFVTIAGFYISTVEEYYTGVLYLGYINGPTEGIIITCIAFIWSGIYGVASWHVPLSAISCMSWLTTIVPSNTTFAQIFVWSTILLFIFTQLPVSIYAIGQVCNEKNLSKIKVYWTVFRPLVISGLAIAIWLTSNCTVIFAGQHFILFSIFLGLLFGEMASDIILAHLTKSPFPKFNSIYYSLFIFVALTTFGDLTYNGIHDDTALLVITFATFIHYMIRAVRVINAFCQFLNIRCLVIPTHSKPILPTTTPEQTESLAIASNTSNYQSI